MSVNEPPEGLDGGCGIHMEPVGTHLLDSAVPDASSVASPESLDLCGMSGAILVADPWENILACVIGPICCLNRGGGRVDQNLVATLGGPDSTETSAGDADDVESGDVSELARDGAVSIDEA